MFDQLKPVSSEWRLTRGCVIDGKGKKCSKLISFTTTGLSEDFFTAFFRTIINSPHCKYGVWNFKEQKGIARQKENVSLVADSTAALPLT